VSKEIHPTKVKFVIIWVLFSWYQLSNS
jgi:hypothetical protein